MSFALFGATGKTGRHFLKIALSNGKKVNALVRTPDKIPAELRHHPNLTLLQGSFHEVDIIKKTIEGTEYVVVMAGDPKLSQKEKFMLKLTQMIVQIMKEYKIKRILYQAGGFSPKAGETLDWMSYILRNTIGAYWGLTPMLEDNDAVIEYLDRVKEEIEWIITRPALIQEEASRGKLVAGESMCYSLTYVDLAQVSFELIQDSNRVHVNYLLDYAKN